MTTGALCLQVWNGADALQTMSRNIVRRCPFGRAKMTSRRNGSTNKGGRTGKGTRMRSLIAQAPHSIRFQVDYAVAFLTGLPAALVGCFGEVLFSARTFSFAVNSCLILAAMTSVSTL
jgi:hypothetical protein